MAYEPDAGTSSQALLQARPTTATVGSVNFLAWGLDLFPAHGTTLGSNVWIDYGRLVDGGYMFNYNTSPVGGVADPIYLPNMMLQFPLRAGGSDFGVLGFWLLVNVPFLGPLALLPYLHTVRRDLWTR